ncbi:RNA polymerase sigma-70 factor (ECF subfamily) [Granulicella aggregans]|uniref:RNA polymerase sigma-70 factor (ECF subfamily) n=1 Tax=Granulicella aggregans TaxID=474949 RepID=A0A7W7ZJX5_9BACT|nr:sigma-70 family RNA polymerase sigma factor [Granulicella aggregans]MBB5061299.1 RNA polymerase sigma-70 factor (ECF subfamily) [Granulicella aggregans]
MSSDSIAYFPNELVEASETVEAVGGRAHPCEDASSSIVLSDPTDEQLLAQIGKGSRDALGVLFRRHARTVFHVAWRILRDESEADDLRQEVFLYIAERAELFDHEKGSGASWIRQVTYHRAIDRRRYLSVRQHYNLEEFNEQRPPGSEMHSTPADLDGKAIRECLSGQLTIDQQQTLELHLFEGYTLREISEKSGQTLGNVKHHYYRALERLRSHLFPQKRG